jgi:hypothetical protein
MGLRSFWNKMLVKFRDIDERISSNAFGRVFRLDGSGHVSTSTIIATVNRSEC